MSGLVINENNIDESLIQTKQIKVQRANCINIGVRIWFQIMSSDGEMFQRWSMNMCPTDEVMLLVKEGDTLELRYIHDRAEDLVNCTFKPFERNVILNARFVITNW